MPAPRPEQSTYQELLAVVGLMRGFPAPWYVSGGWAIDIFLGRATREHSDLEIGIARQDQAHLHPHLSGWTLYKIARGAEDWDLMGWMEGEWLALPIHQIVAQRPGASPGEFEFFLNEMWDGQWRFRRDESIRRPFAASYLWTEAGIPVIAPEIELLYKAAHHRPKDEHDFRAALSPMGPERRRWLREVLQSYQPDDPWIAELEK